MNTGRSKLVGVAFLLLGCGGPTVEPAGSGPTGGTGGMGGMGAGGTGGMSAGGAGGMGAGGAAGGCDTPNPQGCVSTGCNAGLTCDINVGCYSSSCTCSDGNWVCDPDCGGGKCVLVNGATHSVRIGFVQGQEATGDFCVAYDRNASGNPIWDSVGLLESNGITPTEIQGLDKLSRYLPLQKAPVAFGKTYGTCFNDSITKMAEAPDNATYFTLLTVPYSNEADTMWVLGDAGPGVEFSPGVRVVNAGIQTHPLAVTFHYGVDLPFPGGVFEFSNEPMSYVDPGGPGNHLHGMTVVDQVTQSSHEFSFIGFDLLPLISTTIFVSGVGLFDKYQVLACLDANPTNLANAKLSNCWHVE